MNFRELHEAEVVDFAERAEQTLKGIGGLAKSAFGKFKSTKDKAEAEAKKAEEEAKKAEEEAKKAEKSEQSQKKSQLLAKAGPKTAHITLAGLLLDRTPEEGDLPELEDIDAEHFQYILGAIEQIQSRFDKFTKNLSKVLRTAPFINAQDRSEVSDRLGDQNDRIVDASETMLMQDKYGERNAWMHALTNNDPNVGAKALMAMLGKISNAHSKLNQAQDKKSYAEGLNIINVLGAQRQVLEMRIGLMKAALDKLSQKPAITEALLKRVRRLATRL